MANLSNINGKFVVEQTTGYVGVGTTDPNYPIEVLNASAEIALNASGGSIYRLRSDSTDSFRINKNGVGDRLIIAGNGDATFAGSVEINNSLLVNVNANNKGIQIANSFALDNASTFLYLAGKNTAGTFKTGQLELLHDGSLNLRSGGSGTTTAYGTIALKLDTSQNVTVNDGGFFLNKSDGAYISLKHNNSLKGYLGIANQVITGGSSADLGLTASNDLVFGSGGSTERMRIDSSGNVGIGVVPNAVTAGNIRLDVGYPGCGITSRQNAELVLTSNADYATATTTGRNAIMVNLQNDGNFSISNAPSNTAGQPLAFTPRFYINTSGNVGIGTNSPDYLLDLYKSTGTTSTATGTTMQRLWNYVGGDISQQKTFIDFVFQDDNSNEYPQVRIGAEVGQNGDANTQIKEGSGAFVVYTNNATGVGPGSPTGLAERFRVGYNGAIGIGGANFGSAGQVLTSNGDTAPSWQDGASYEEGTFYTNVIAASSGLNYSASGNNGRYTKIGKQVIVTFQYSVSAGTGQKYMVISNLPFVQHTASHDEQGYCSNYPRGQRRSGIVVNNSSGESNTWYVGWYNDTAQSSNGLRATIIYTTT